MCRGDGRPQPGSTPSRTRGLTPFVGRDGELAELLEHWDDRRRRRRPRRADERRAGDRQVAPRARAVPERLRLGGATLRLRCSPYNASSTLFPFVEHSSDRRRQRARGGAPARPARGVPVPLGMDIDTTPPLIAELLAIPTGSRYPVVPGLARAAQAAHARDPVRLAEAQAVGQPSLVVDRGRPVGRSDHARVPRPLLRLRAGAAADAAAHAPRGLRASLAASAHVRHMALEPSGTRRHARDGQRADRRARAAGGARGADRRADRRRAAVRRGDHARGARVGMDRGGVERAGDVGLAAGTARALDPPRVAARAARRPRRGAASRRCSRCGPRGLRSSCCARSPSSTTASSSPASTASSSRDLVRRRHSPAGTIFVLKHWLVQDVAYESLLRSSRRRYHGRSPRAPRRAARGRRDPAGVRRPSPDCAAQDGDAIVYLRRAGELAHHRSANDRGDPAPGPRARASLAQPTRQIGRLELTLLIALGAPLTAAKGYSVLEVEQTYAGRRAVPRRRRRRLGRVLPRALRHLARAPAARRLRSARDFAARLLRLAEWAGTGRRLGGRPPRAGQHAFYIGDDPATAREHSSS